MNATLTRACGLTDDGGLVLQLSIPDQGQINNLRAWVDGYGWLPWRAVVRGATWRQPYPFTAPTTLTAVFGLGCYRPHYIGRVEANAGAGRWSTMVSFDWTPGTPMARLDTTRPAPRVTRSMRPASAGRRPQSKVGRLLGWLDRLGE